MSKINRPIYVTYDNNLNINSLRGMFHEAYTLKRLIFKPYAHQLNTSFIKKNLSEKMKVRDKLICLKDN